MAYGQYTSFITYNLDNGLPSNTAYFILKDDNGYVWIATDRGLVKYNGYEFKVYTTQDGLSDNEMFEVFQDSKQRIWFSTLNGVPTVYSNNTFFSFDFLFEKYNILPVGPCFRILEINNALWILTRKHLFKYVDNRILIFPANKMTYVSMSHNERNKKLSILLAYSSQSLVLDVNTHKIDTVQLRLPKPTTISKSIIKGNKLYYTSWKHLCIFDLESGDGDSILFETELLSIFDSNNDSLVFIGANTHVFEFNTFSKKAIIKFDQQPEVTSIFKDTDRSYWVSSLNNGVSYFGNENVEVLTNENVLPFEYVSKVRKTGNRLFLTSDKFRFCVFNLATKKIESNFNDAEKYPGRGFANSICLSPNGDVYVSFRIILLKVDQNGTVSKLPLRQVNYDIFYTNEHIVSLHAEHIARRPLTASIFQNILDFETLPIMARHLYFDEKKSDIYAYGAGGLMKLNVDSFSTVKMYNDIEEIENNVTSFSKVNDSIFIVGTSDNGVHFIKHDKVFASLTANNGLLSNYIQCIFVDSNEIWLGTDRGIDLIKIKPGNSSLDIQHIGKRDGIFSNEITDIYIEHDTVYAASPSGLFFFHKKNIEQVTDKPILNIEYVKVNGKELVYTNIPHLKPSQNNIKFKFTGISYHSSGNILYRYKLAPYQNDWHYTSSREIEYPSLTPNDYLLTVQCRGSRGDWSSVQRIKFSIMPAFWQRRGVQVLLVMLFLGVVVLIVFYRFKAIKRSHTIKEKLLRLENENLENLKNQAIKDKELIELEQQALRLHMNPHFIFNAINAIQGFYAGNEISKAKQFISYFSKLLRMILETSKEKVIPVTIEVEIIKNYLELFLLRFEDKYDYTIDLSPEIDSETMLIPPMIVQPFVENAVLHGISPMKSKGRISIRFEMDNGLVKISIQDNGIGRKKSAELKMFNKSKSTGIKVTQMRLKHINNQLNIHQYVEIVDLDDGGESTGTLVILRVPLTSKYE